MLAVTLLGALVACGPAAPADPSNDGSTTTPASPLRPAAPVDPVVKGSWHLQTSIEGAILSFAAAENAPLIRLHCAAAGRPLLIDLPSVPPVGSEERLSFGGGGEVVSLVADVRGDSAHGGVGGSGATPAMLEAMLRAGPGASYGATAIGPLPPVSVDKARRFAAACRPSSVPLVPPPSPCREQDGKTIAEPAVRATGTEPFWGADIDGRCVTYSTPEKPTGVRLWTRFSRSAAGANYAGSLDGKSFRMNIRREANCSDGMSDRRYPMAVQLRIGGETRRGCAAPR